MKVSKLLTMHGMLVLTINPDFTLAEAARRLAKPVGGRKLSAAIVTDTDDHVVGVLSLGDISAALGQFQDKAAEKRVREVMTTDVQTCTRDDDIEDVLRRMAQLGIRHMPIVENDRLAGLIARRDALEFLYQQAALDVENLTEFLFRSDARF